MANREAQILLVDDAKVNRILLKKHLDGNGYIFHEAEDGQIALDMLKQEPDKYDVILLDLMMPNMDGSELLAKIKADSELSYIPVIIQSALTESSEIAKAISAGALYYITKPYSHDELTAIVKTATRDALAYKKAQDSIKNGADTITLLSHGTFTFATIDEAESLANFLSQLYPNPQKVKTGLQELLINSVEHGNLGITYDEKTILNNNARWCDEVHRRLGLEENTEKYVTVEIINEPHTITTTITDMGQGFDWQNYIEPSPDRMMDNHGRGIAMANLLSFTSIEYFGAGNIVVAKFIKSCNIKEGE